MFQNVYNKFPLHLKIPIPWLKWAIPSDSTVIFLNEMEYMCVGHKT